MTLKGTQTERRVIFSILMLSVMIPLLIPIGWKTEVTPHVRMVYDLVESTQEASVVIISFDYDPATATELQPMAYSLIEHAWKRNQKIIAMALWPQGAQMADEAFNRILEKYPEKMYGVDYINIGYKTGGMVTLQAMGRNMMEVFPTDIKGTSLSQIQMMQGVNSLKNIAYVISLSAGDPGIKQWIMAARDIFGVSVSGGTTAVSAPGFLPYINQQNQLTGLLGGLKAASEYESLLNVIGPATVKMDSQSIAHLLILILVLVGNIKAWKLRKANRHNVM